jgi:hypothetical protein
MRRLHVLRNVTGDSDRDGGDAPTLHCALHERGRLMADGSGRRGQGDVGSIGHHRVRDLLRKRRDFGDHLAHMRLATAGGPQELLCIEYTALGLWLATIQEGRVTSRTRERLRLFRSAVMAAASEILMGRIPPARPPQGRLEGLTEQRLAHLERAVFVGEPDEAETSSGDSRAARCPHCGGALRVTVGTLQIAPGEE